jgi:hypothetical protein
MPPSYGPGVARDCAARWAERLRPSAARPECAAIGGPIYPYPVSWEPSPQRGKTTKSLLIIAATAALLIVSACDSEKTQQVTPQATPQTETTRLSAEPTNKEQANRYLAIIEPVNEASARFAAETVGRHVSVTRKEWDSIVKPFLAAIKKSNTALLRADWSPTVRADIRSLADADAAWMADLSPAYDTPDAGAVIARDIAASRVAANAVRGDLGLPPAKPFDRSGAHL